MKLIQRRETGFARRTLAQAGVAATLAFSGLAVAAPAFAGPGTAPSSGPQYVSWALPGNGAMTIVWNAPNTNTGAAVTGYQIDVTSGVSTGSCTTPADVYYCTITGLTNSGVPFSVKGYALAGANKSPATTFFNQAPEATRPYPATSPTWAQDGESVIVSWTNPTNFGSVGEARSPYSIVYAFPQGQSLSTGVYTTAPSCTSATGASSCRFANGSLTPGVKYNFLVRAFNSNAGAALSDPSSEYVATILPGQLQGSGPTVTASTTGATPSITVSWPAWGSAGAPAINGAAITGYKVLIWGTPYDFTPAQAGCDVATPCSATFNNSGVGGTNAGIAYAKWYHPVVAAVNSAGVGLYSYQPAVVFPGYAPSAPTGLTITKRSATTARLFWNISNPSSSDGGWQISSYAVTLYDARNNVGCHPEPSRQPARVHGDWFVGRYVPLHGAGHLG
jgi:hypothetical protein